jgi:hypothetical protein
MQEILERKAHKAVIIAGKRRVLFVKPKDKKKRKSHKYYQSWKERELKEYMKDYLINSRNFRMIQISENLKNKINKTNVKFDTDKDNPLIQIHRRWGHLSESRIKLAYKKGLVLDDKFNYNDIKDLIFFKKLFIFYSYI